MLDDTLGFILKQMKQLKHILLVNNQFVFLLNEKLLDNINISKLNVKKLILKFQARLGIYIFSQFAFNFFIHIGVNTLNMEVRKIHSSMILHSSKEMFI